MDLADLARRIAALKAKTIAAGCTQAEAEAAAEHADRLLRQYGVSADTLALSQLEAAEVRQRGAKSQAAVALCSAIALHCRADVVYGSMEITYIGRPADLMIATYLHEVLFRALDVETKAMQESSSYRRRRSRAAKQRATSVFRGSMAQALAQRLRSLSAGRASSEERAALEAARAKAKEVFPGLTTFKARTVGNHRDDAYRERGRAAAQRVAIHDGVSADRPAPRLTSQ